MSWYHISLAHQRTDTIEVQSKSKDKLLSFFNSVSKSIVRNIKEIVYSKSHNINYTPKKYIPSDTWKKVLVSARSKNHSKVFTLFNVKKTVTQRDIINNFKNLYIKTEPITDFSEILFFPEGDLSPYETKNLFQVQYKRNGKTYVEDYHCKNWNILLNALSNIIDGEITEIREYLYSDSKRNIKQFTDVSSGVSVYVSDNSSRYSFKITNLKTSVSYSKLLTHIKDTFTISNKPIKLEKINLKYL